LIKDTCLRAAVFEVAHYNNIYSSFFNFNTSLQQFSEYSFYIEILRKHDLVLD